jgi:ribosomal RNA-processing protein 12
MDPTLDERLERIRHSPRLQSQQQVRTALSAPGKMLRPSQTHLVLSAVEDTLRDQKTDFTPTAYFAALLALLGQYITSSKGVVNKDVASAIVYLLDLITPHVPTPLLRSKFSQILQKLAIVLTYPHAEAPLLRPSIGCLESLLLVQDSQAWAQSPAQISPRRAVAGLLTIAVDHRPKVRKRAHDAIAKVLKNPPPSPSLDHPAADMCAETALRSLKDGVELYKQEKKQHKDPHPHTPNLIHTLQLIKVIADASGGWPSRKTDNLCEALLDISRSSNEYLTMASFEVFEVIFEGMSEEVSSTKLPHLLEILEGLQPSENDTQLMPPWIAVLSRGYDVSAQVKPDDTFQKIHLVFDKVSRFMSSVSYNIRASAADCLISFLVNCVPTSALTEPEHSTDEILKHLSKSASDLLNVKYQSAWMDSFRVFGVMFDTFRWRSAPLLSEIVRTVGQLRSSESFNGKKEADAVLSKAIRAMGPEEFLKILPLNLAIKTSEPGRVWLLPLLRDAVSNTSLGHFKMDLVPLSQKMYQKIVDHGDAEKTVEIKIYETIVSQIWATLHGYCDLPMDLSKVSHHNSSWPDLTAI